MSVSKHYPLGKVSSSPFKPLPPVPAGKDGAKGYKASSKPVRAAEKYLTKQVLEAELPAHAMRLLDSGYPIPYSGGMVKKVKKGAVTRYQVNAY